MTLFAAKGQQIKLIIDGKFIGKKVNIWKFWAKSMLSTSKESLEYIEFRFRCKNFDFLWKNPFFSIFQFFFQRGDPLVSERNFFHILIFQNFQKKILKMASMGPKKCWMKQSHEIWPHLGHPLRSDEGSSTCAGTKCPPHVV